LFISPSLVWLGVRTAFVLGDCGIQVEVTGIQTLPVFQTFNWLFQKEQVFLQVEESLLSP
jgi:hypothetical protein